MEISKIDWWNDKRREYNKGLLISAAIILTLVSCVFYFVDTGMFSYLPYYAIFYLFYIVILNFFLILLEFTDRQLNVEIDNKKKNILFKSLLWFSIEIPLVFCIYFISMAY